MANITIMNNTAMMSTLQIAELTDKLHFNVLRDVRDLIETLKIDAFSSEPTSVDAFSSDGTSTSIVEDVYIDKANRESTIYLLDEEMALTLVSGYNATLRNRIIKEWIAYRNGFNKALAADTAEAKDDALMGVKEELVRIRQSMRECYSQLTDTIRDNQETLALNKFAYSTVNNLICNTVFGVQPAKVKEKTGMSPRDYLVTLEDIIPMQTYDNIASRIESLIDAGVDYKTIKERIKSRYPTPIVQLD